VYIAIRSVKNGLLKIVKEEPESADTNAIILFGGSKFQNRTVASTTLVIGDCCQNWKLRIFACNTVVDYIGTTSW
jgi:hypothetical protein